MLEAIDKAVLAARKADDKKAEDITVLDLRGICTFTDAFVICTGSSSLQLRAISNSIDDGLRDVGIRKSTVDGSHHGSWIVMDYGDVVVHIMTPESRDYYRLEGLWGDGKEIGWEEAERAGEAMA